ncbi:MAG: hypothetical protein ACM3MJ_01495 [Deltaproteobacteria bacterium]
MGFFDTVKDKAGAIAADAGRAGRVTAAQARLAVLQNDLRKAERELGHAAFALAERGELDHPDLAHAVERLRATAAEIGAKEAEIAALRNEPLAPADASEEEHAPAASPSSATVQTVAGPVTVTPATAEPEMAAATTAAEVPVAAAAPPEVPAAAPPEAVGRPDAETAVAEAPAKPARRRAAPKPATPVAKKAPKKTPAAGKATVKKTAEKAGATPKKSSRPRSGPRPAGKNRPAGT